MSDLRRVDAASGMTPEERQWLDVQRAVNNGDRVELWRGKHGRLHHVEKRHRTTDDYRNKAA